jgi:hypothetical protein
MIRPTSCRRLPPRPRAQAADGQRRGIVDIERQFGQALAGERKLLEILAADAAHAQRFGTDARLFGQDTRGELVRAHFQAEEGDRRADRILGGDAIGLVAPQPVGRIEGDVGDERGLAHARAAGEDDKVRIVQPADLLVHRGKAGGLARDVAARKQRLLDHFQRGARGHAEALRLVAGLRPFGHGIERGFGAFDLFERGYRIAGVARAFHQVAAHRHQFAQQREVIDLLGQFARGEQALPVRRQPGEIGGAAQFLQPFVAFEIGLERDRRDHRLAIDQRQDAFIDAAVDRREEMLGLQRGGEFLQNPVVDQHRAQKRGFRLDVGGRVRSLQVRAGGSLRLPT